MLVMRNPANVLVQLFKLINSATVSASDSMLGGRKSAQIFEDAGAKINTTLMDFIQSSPKKNTDSARFDPFGDAEDFAIIVRYPY